MNFKTEEEAMSKANDAENRKYNALKALWLKVEPQ